MKKLAFSFQCLTFVLSLATVAPLKETAEAQGSDTRWGPVLKKDGNEEELPSDPKKKLGDKEWMNVTYREYNGAKPSIAVIMAGNQAPNQTYWEWSDGVNSYKIPIEAYQVPNGAPVAAIEDLLTAVLMNTNRFTVADRQQLADVRAEQQLGTDGSSTAQTAPPPGRIIGARYLIKAVVNEWKDGASRSGGGGGVLGGGLPGIIGSGFSRSSAEVDMSFKVIDATTAQVIAAYTESAKTTSWGITPGFLLWGNSSVVGALAHFEKNSPATYAVLAAINKGVYDVVMGLKEEAWAGAIMDVSEDGVYVTGGEGAGLKVGMTLMASSKGKDLTDPTTGQAIHTEGHELGSLTIDKVYDKYAVAHPADGCQPVHKGDIIRIKE